ncbi:MAG TPA: peptidylprolyl isomerase [Actinomycetota bacterium]|nr:peptidylprolyl isomerase [Actinomycetota bacterium]
MRLRRPAIFGTALTTAVVAAAALLLGLRAGRGEDRGPVIVRVDGVAIYLADARARLEGLRAVHGEEAVGPDWRETVLRSLVDDVLIREEAERRGIRIGPGEVALAVERIRAGLGGPAAFERWLEERGMDLAELERRVGLNLLGARVYQAVTEGVTVTPEEVRAYYREHREEFGTADGRVPRLPEVRVSIRQTLMKEERDRAFAEWLEGRRREARVVVVLPDWWRRL